jgi:hypothetical protein
MIRLTPTERLEWLRDQSYLVDARATLIKLLVQYERFLDTTNVDEAELVSRFLDKNTSRRYMDAAYNFGDLMFAALNSIGQGNRFHRILVV